MDPEVLIRWLRNYTGNSKAGFDGKMRGDWIRMMDEFPPHWSPSITLCLYVTGDVAGTRSAAKYGLELGLKTFQELLRIGLPVAEHAKDTEELRQVIAVLVRLRDSE